MAKRILGYNIVFRAAIEGVEKLFGGTTSNSFDITPKIKDSITKEDLGQTNKSVVGHDTDFSIDGIVEINDEADKSKKLDRVDLIALVLLGEPIDFVYGETEPGKTVYKGKMLITKYSEKTDSENEATYSVSCSAVTKLTPEVIPVV